MPVVNDLVKNYDNGIKLKLTLRKINNQIKYQSNPFIKENLRNWARKYRRKIKALSMARFKEYKKEEELKELKELMKAAPIRRYRHGRECWIIKKF